MTKQSSKGAPMIIGLLGIIVLVGSFAFPIVKVIIAPPADADPPAACDATKPRFMAYDRNTNPDNFGPPVAQREEDKVRKELGNRLQTDPALTSALEAYMVNGNDYSDYRRNAVLYRSDRDKWCAAVKRIDKVVKDAKSVTVERAAGRYRTLWFVRGDGNKVVPSLKQGAIPERASSVLKIVAKDGEVYRLRLECGFQPFDDRFPDVPPLDTPPDRTPPPKEGGPPPNDGGPPPGNPPQCTEDCGGNPPPCRTNCGPPPCTYNCEPPKEPQSFDEQQNESPPRQDPQNNDTSGVDTGPTRGAPNQPSSSPQGNGGSSGTTPSGGGSDGSGGTQPDNPPDDTGQGDSGDTGSGDNEGMPSQPPPP